MHNSISQDAPSVSNEKERVESIPQQSFADIKKRLLEIAVSDSDCIEYKKALKAESLEELLLIIKRNLAHCCGKYSGTATLLNESFPVELLHKHHIYTAGVHSIIVTEGEATIKTCGTSTATIETWGTSTATIETWDTSTATIETCGTSTATIKTWGTSTATIETWDTSTATIETCGTSTATIETWDTSTATIETWDTSTATIAEYSGTLKYEIGDGACPLIKHLTLKKVFVKTSDFQIVQL